MSLYDNTRYDFENRIKDKEDELDNLNEQKFTLDTEIEWLDNELDNLRWLLTDIDDLKSVFDDCLESDDFETGGTYSNGLGFEIVGRFPADTSLSNPHFIVKYGENFFKVEDLKLDNRGFADCVITVHELKGEK
jgi:hypothetical protein